VASATTRVDRYRSIYVVVDMSLVEYVNPKVMSLLDGLIVMYPLVPVD